MFRSGFHSADCWCRQEKHNWLVKHLGQFDRNVDPNKVFTQLELFKCTIEGQKEFWEGWEHFMALYDLMEQHYPGEMERHQYAVLSDKAEGNARATFLGEGLGLKVLMRIGSSWIPVPKPTVKDRPLYN